METYRLQDDEIFIIYRKTVKDMLISHAFYNLSVEDISKLIKDYFEFLQKIEIYSLIEQINEEGEEDN